MTKGRSRRKPSAAGSIPAASSGSKPPKAQDFAQSGKGAAYHDTNAVNSYQLYRPDEAEDIDVRGSGTCEVRSAPVEWFGYTVQVPQGGNISAGAQRLQAC